MYEFPLFPENKAFIKLALPTLNIAEPSEPSEPLFVNNDVPVAVKIPAL